MTCKELKRLLHHAVVTGDLPLLLLGVKLLLALDAEWAKAVVKPALPALGNVLLELRQRCVCVRAPMCMTCGWEGVCLLSVC